MAGNLMGVVTWSMERDAAGHRHYTVLHKVHTDSYLDGPATVLLTPGLPLPGSFWGFGNDIDLWAFCLPQVKVSVFQQREGDRHVFWITEHKFSTLPYANLPGRSGNRCQDAQIEDPLLEPPLVSGSFTKYTEEATHDRFGLRILNSAHEPVRGPQVEFDHNRPTVRIEMNLPALNLYILSRMVDTVNSVPMWGMPRRCVKLSNAAWERKFYGLCYVYYTLTLDFDISFSTFDRNILDEGSKVLNGHWSTTTAEWVLDDVASGLPPNRNNPAHFIRAKDRNEENITLILNGQGEPADDITGRLVEDVDKQFGPGRVVIVTTAHGLVNDDVVAVFGVTGSVEANGVWKVQVVDADGFVILDQETGDPVEPSGDTESYEGGGRWYKKGLTGPGNIHVERYFESDFFILGVPAVL